MKIILSIMIIVTVLAAACSDEGKSQEKQDHVWKEQTQALDKAKAVEGVLRDSARAQKQQIEEETK